METKTYTTIDREAKGWPSGPWDGEPDKVQWPDAKTGLPCLAVRHSRAGHWCGYVGISPGHPLHGVPWGEQTHHLDAHGGVNYSEFCQPLGDEESKGICHSPSEGEPHDVWWLGFDCGHSGDYAPSDAVWRGLYVSGDDVYRTLAYVQSECASLAEQLAAAASVAEGGAQ